MRQYKYETWVRAKIWCHQHLCLDKDFNHTDEHVVIREQAYLWPEYLYLSSKEDLVALKLAVKME